MERFPRSMTMVHSVSRYASTARLRKSTRSASARSTGTRRQTGSIMGSGCIIQAPGAGLTVTPLRNLVGKIFIKPPAITWSMRSIFLGSKGSSCHMTSLWTHHGGKESMNHLIRNGPKTWTEFSMIFKSKSVKGEKMNAIVSKASHFPATAAFLVPFRWDEALLMPVTYRGLTKHLMLLADKFKKD